MAELEVIDQKEAPPNANVIGKSKKNDDGVEIQLKARNVLHGNRDGARFDVWRDSSSADLSVVRLVLSLEVVIGFSFATADIKRAYLKSGTIKREIDVHLQGVHVQRRRLKGKMNTTLWRVLKLPYGIVEAWRDWMCATENWILKSYGMERVPGADQLFVCRGTNTAVILLVEKVVDKLLVVDLEDEIKRFFRQLDKVFTMEASNVGGEIRFLGCNISIKEDSFVEMKMDDYLRRIKPLRICENEITTHILRPTTTSAYSIAPSQELCSIWSSASCLRPGWYRLKLQQRLGQPIVKHISETNDMVGNIMRLRLVVTFKRPYKPDSTAVGS